MRESAELGIVCIGATLVLLIGRLDLSVGAVLAISALIVIVGFKVIGLPWPFLVAVAVLFGLAAGAFNGVLTAVVGIPSFIATLGTLIILRGVLQWATATAVLREANSIFTDNPSFRFVGNGLVLGAPVSLWLLGLLFVIVLLALRVTRLGTAIYAIGGNIQAATRAGLPIRRLEIGVFALAGVCSALAGVLLASRLDSVSFQTGQYLEFKVLVAVILGGTSVAGGQGGVWGTLLGVAFVGILNNGMVMLTIDRDIQDVVVGLFLVMALIVDRWLNQSTPAEWRRLLGSLRPRPTDGGGP